MGCPRYCFLLSGNHAYTFVVLGFCASTSQIYVPSAWTKRVEGSNHSLSNFGVLSWFSPLFLRIPSGCTTALAVLTIPNGLQFQAFFGNCQNAKRIHQLSGFTEALPCFSPDLPADPLTSFALHTSWFRLVRSTKRYCWPLDLVMRVSCLFCISHSEQGHVLTHHIAWIFKIVHVRLQCWIGMQS